MKSGKKIYRLSQKNKNTAAGANKKRLKYVCWYIAPVLIVALLVLDALGIYTFNTQRLTVLGIGLLVILLPFIGEVTIKNISIKLDEDESDSHSARLH